jgi:hypothetical protein
VEITVGELIEQLSVFDKNSVIRFGGGDLDFYRLKHRGRDLTTGEELVSVEFQQLVYRDDEGQLVIDEVG